MYCSVVPGIEADVAVWWMLYSFGFGCEILRVTEAEEMALRRRVLVPWRARIGDMSSERVLLSFHLPVKSWRVLVGWAAMLEIFS